MMFLQAYVLAAGWGETEGVEDQATRAEEALGEASSIITEARAILERLSEHGIDSPQAQNLLGRAEELLAAAVQSYRDHSYGQAYGLANAASQVGHQALRLADQLEKAFREAEEIVREAVALRRRLTSLAEAASPSSFVDSLISPAYDLIEQSLAIASENQGQAVSLLNQARQLINEIAALPDSSQVSTEITRSEVTQTSQDGPTVSVENRVTSAGHLSIYGTEQRLVYPNGTVVVVRQKIVSLRDSTIIQKEVETIRQADQTPTLAPQKQIGVKNGVSMGAIIALSRSQSDPSGFAVSKTEMDVGVVSLTAQREAIKLVLDAPQGTAGRLIVVDVERALLGDILPKDIAVKLDNEIVPLAESVTDVLAGTVEQPRYFLAVTGHGLQIVLYVPHWSTRVVTIGSSIALILQTPLQSILQTQLQTYATYIGIVLMLAAAVVLRLRRHSAKQYSSPEPFVSELTARSWPQAS